MIFDNAVTISTFVLSAIALFFATRKQKHDERNLDADTIGKLYDLIDRQEMRSQEVSVKLDGLRAEVEVLRGEKKEREDTIETMKRENADLTEQVEKLTKAVKSRDRRICELEKQVSELTARLNAMNAGCEGDA